LNQNFHVVCGHFASGLPRRFSAPSDVSAVSASGGSLALLTSSGKGGDVSADTD
jgi:hypothetical protein